GKIFDGSKKLWEVFAKNPESIKDLFAKEYNAALKPGGDYIYYSFIKLTTQKTEAPKTSFIYGIPDWQWLVGAGVYLDDIETGIAAMQAGLQKRLRTDIQTTVLLATAIIAIFLLLFHLFSRRLLNDFAIFATFFTRAAQSDQEIDRRKIRFKEFYRMAGDANRMLSDKNIAQHKLRESEEKYRTFFENSTDAMLITRGNYFVDCNAAAVEMLGYASKKEFLDRHPGKLSPETQPDGQKSRDKALKMMAIARTKGSHRFEWNHVRKNGEIFPVEVSLTAIPTGDEILLHTVWRDITDRRRAAEEQLKLKKLESVGLLAGGIAHDFNNLLTGLFGNLEMAGMFLPADHKARKFLDAAGQSMENATNLTKQLLTFAKGGDPIKKTLSIGEVIAETARFSLRGGNARLQTSIAPDLWLVEADKGQLSQVISNLVINAQQAMPTGGTITITAGNIKTAASRRIQITVRDEGVGIAPEHLSTVFDPYFSTKQQGSGLGLASAYSIISKHGGTITVDSKLNQGTTFTIRLPAADKAAETIPEKPVAEINPKSVAAARILVLDDEEVVREILGDMLEELGHQVDHAAHGREAVEKYRQAWENNSPFDLVITDLTIPGGMGGEETAREILAIDPRAKIIVSSGYATDPVMAHYEEYGFQGRVAKPYRFAELREVIRKAGG
ncbi:MAG: ATP-binding protein, partial [Pseudomonadota bacterium]|nr:ATP-binding protein [Pseudomonadota bacterium]